MFFKHTGTGPSNKKVIIVQRSIEGEDHMAAVIYPDIIPSRYHDDLMKLLESVEGQDASEFKDILGRRSFQDGGNMLQTLYTNGFIKKLATNAVVVRPNAKSSVKLDELNRLLIDIRAGRTAEGEIKVVAPVYDTAALENAPVQMDPPVNLSEAPAPIKDQMETRMERLENMMASMHSLLTEQKVPKTTKPRKA